MWDFLLMLQGYLLLVLPCVLLFLAFVIVLAAFVTSAAKKSPGRDKGDDDDCE